MKYKGTLLQKFMCFIGFHYKLLSDDLECWTCEDCNITIKR